MKVCLLIIIIIFNCIQDIMYLYSSFKIPWIYNYNVYIKILRTNGTKVMKSIVQILTLCLMYVPVYMYVYIWIKFGFNDIQCKGD